ncbi:hypothetical protein KZJ38_01040 [Paraburkholderia edwinii]|uniref:Uncharacterized protein n=1 Tax=Paraburkholderia edwinii TaxID=2861782 RepID=A0ABX8UJ39_9BURK|nr:hypothetical protein [Paraburkholderia edwinii]QYD69017.1 hypothetical protein KZJ38_01040 [Paraburkholderia edwinii]
MSRQFLTDNADSSTVSSNQKETIRPADSAEQTAERTLNEVLAGALPEWDLLPAAPFVRRVK